MKPSTILFYLTLFLCSCSPIEDTVTKTIFPLENMNMAFYATIDSSVRLSNNDDVYISTVNGLQYYKGKFYIFDLQQNSSLFIFDKLGNLINKTKHGKGPGELNSPTGFTISQDRILINDWPNLKYFGLDGNYIKMIEFPNGFYSNSLLEISDQKFISYGCTPCRSELSNDTDSLFQYHVVSQNLKKEFLCIQPLNGFEWSAMNFARPFCRFNNHFLLLTPPGNEILVFDGKASTHSYKVDFGSKTFTDQDFDKGIRYFSQMLYEDKKYGYIDHITETNMFITFSYNGSGAKRKYIIYSKKGEFTGLFSKILKKSKLPECYPLSTNKEGFICALYPSDYSESELTKMKSDRLIESDITVYSNPILLFITVKLINNDE